VYARVSSADRRPDLDRQVARVTEWVTGQNLSVDRVVTEVGSALNGHRRKFLTLLRDKTVTTIDILDRDVNAAVNLARLAASGADSDGRGADRQTPAGVQVAVKRQPGTRQRGQTGTVPTQDGTAA